MPILGIPENRLAAVASIHHAANRPGLFHSEPPASGPQLAIEGVVLDRLRDMFSGDGFRARQVGTVFASGLQAPTSLAIRRNSVFIPTLTIIKSGSNAVLSWSLAAANYNLKSTTNLAIPVWLPASGTLFTNGGNLVLTNAINGSARFFHLSNP